MTPDEFDQHVEQARSKHPQRFEVAPDAPPDETEIEAHQAELGVRFPADYLDFLRRYGGGTFVFLSTYSMDRTSKLNVVTKNAASWLDRKDFVAVADDGSGDYYGFTVDDAGRCLPEVVLLDHETHELSPDAPGWFESLVDHALRL
jgi:hypothetical protein